MDSQKQKVTHSDSRLDSHSTMDLCLERLTDLRSEILMVKLKQTVTVRVKLMVTGMDLLKGLH